jgi:DNA-binding NtrC family response regulator
LARILIADDDPDYLAAFCDGMKALGHQVTGVDQGSQVVPILQADPYDIVFLDVLMKGGGAITLIHAVRAADTNIPVVIITGKSEIIASPLFEQGLRQAQAKVTKTASLVDLERLVRQFTS